MPTARACEGHGDVKDGALPIGDWIGVGHAHRVSVRVSLDTTEGRPLDLWRTRTAANVDEARAGGSWAAVCELGSPSARDALFDDPPQDGGPSHGRPSDVQGGPRRFRLTRDVVASSSCPKELGFGLSCAAKVGRMVV